eukprot:TRINITY_DN15564_c0_g1_i1.p1 TRINITY_DN15564_c0_g1~~TRINITY_DN15564_c0_g1_i1.p1  ORF type:complete len:166 (+),score=32.93 TRINITY_DN15564_c0_g1_i1:39-536(+)
MASLLLVTAALATQLQSAKEAVVESGVEWQISDGGTVVGYFKGVDGLSTELEVVEYQDGDGLFALRKRPGRAKYGDVTLKRGYFLREGMQQWLNQVVEAGKKGDVSDSSFKRKMRLTQMHHGDPKGSWALYGCWPKQWRVNGFDGKSNDVSTEEIVFVVEDMQIA